MAKNHVRAVGSFDSSRKTKNQRQVEEDVLLKWPHQAYPLKLPLDIGLVHLLRNQGVQIPIPALTLR